MKRLRCKRVSGAGLRFVSDILSLPPAFPRVTLPTQMEILEVEQLCVTNRFRRGVVPETDTGGEGRLVDLSFTLERGASLALVGGDRRALMALALALVKRLRPDAGEIHFSGVAYSTLDEARFRPLRRRLQAVFPDACGQLAPDLTVEGAFREVLAVWHPRISREERHHLVETLMVACGLPEALRGLFPAELDAVERQLVSLARALLPGPDLLVACGLTEGFDVVQRAELLNRLRHLREGFGFSLLLLTDDLAAGRFLGDTLAVLHLGRIVETGPAGRVIERPGHEHTRRLVACTG